MYNNMLSTEARKKNLYVASHGASFTFLPVIGTFIST